MRKAEAYNCRLSKIQASDRDQWNILDASELISQPLVPGLLSVDDDQEIEMEPDGLFRFTMFHKHIQ